MRLHEEYFKRQSAAVSLIRYDTSGALILRTNEVHQWLIVTIKWADGGIHPGLYVVHFSRPVHNGYLHGKLFATQESEELEWDEYEDYFMKWSKDVPAMPAAIHSEREVVLTAWCIFVYIYDGWFAAQPSELRSFVDRALDADLDTRDRYAGYQSCLIYITARHPGILKVWKYEVLALVHHYSDWLARLVLHAQ